MTTLASTITRTLARTLYDGCPLCGSKCSVEIKTANCTKHKLYEPLLPATMRWLECGACEHVYTDGYFESEALKALLSKTQDSQQPGYDLENGRYVAYEMIERIVAATSGSVNGSSRWIDVGFGAGHLLTTAAECGFLATGIDLRADSVKSLAAFGYDVRQLELSDMETDSFDVVAMADVLEHMAFPRQSLQDAHRVLSAGGALFVSMPNMDSFVWKALDVVGQNPYWSELEHYHNFTRERLYRLLGESGFTPVSYGVSKRYRACMEVVALKS